MAYEIQLGESQRDAQNYAEWLRQQGHTVTITEDVLTTAGYPASINIEDIDEAWQVLTGLWDDYRDRPLRDDECGWTVPESDAWKFVG